MVEARVERLVKNIVKAYMVLEEVVGKRVPEDVLVRVLGEVEHIAVHELAHGAIRAVCPEIDVVEEEDPVMGECVDEVLARLLETYVSRRIGGFTHSFEEHVHELEHYTSLSGLSIKAEELEELYEQVSRLVEEKNMRSALEKVFSKCREWVREAQAPSSLRA